jgi:hypothetical protein
MTVQEHFTAYCKFRGRVAIYAPAVQCSLRRNAQNCTFL